MPRPWPGGLCLWNRRTWTGSVPGPCHQGLQPRMAPSPTHCGQQLQAQCPTNVTLGSAAGKQAPKTALLGIPSLPGLASSQHTGGSNPDLTQSVPRSASGPGSWPRWLTCSSCWPGSWATGHLSHTGCSGRPLICGCGPPPAACWVGRRSEATRPVRLACHPLTCS